MPTTISDGFFYVNPFSPPPAGTVLTVADLDIVDQNDDGFIGPGDTVNGIVIDFSYPGDSVTINISGTGNVTYSGITFYMADGTRLFTPIDGQILQRGAFQSSTSETGTGSVDMTLLAPPCFAAGTLIATPSGPRKVEDLSPGEAILTAEGATTTVLWLGRKTCARIRYGALMQPVRIRAGALGEGLPHADLTVTGDHGMVLDGLVINAAALVNGTTIDWVPLADLPSSLTVYHVETENHDVIRANGAPAETFIDYAGRKAFDNFAEYLALYGAERIITEMPAPRISAARLLPATIRTRLGIGENGAGAQKRAG